ncbi:MAG: MoxR family ATPase [Lentisphaerae bacterium]|nr:MAG: MoxR family ATPase [Lentisphaerota bacterium]
MITPAIEQLKENLERVIIGKSRCVELILAGLFSGGHVLLEDVPGVGKTTMAKALAKSLDLQFRRIQFTPDLLPADILGGSIYNPQTGDFCFRKGPIFTNVLLADEINRASPRTQSALLEAMTEAQATVEGTSYPIPQPFMVIATQNPIEFHGTYPLPEAQLDRFALRLCLGYPSEDEEFNILLSQKQDHPLEGIGKVANAETLQMVMETVHTVEVSPAVGRYLVALVTQTRKHPQLRLGASPRASLMLYRTAQALALIRGRNWVSPDDVRELVIPVLAHRLVLNSRVNSPSESKESVLHDIIGSTPPPR